MDKDEGPPGVGGGPKGPDAETPRRIALPTVAEGVQRRRRIREGGLKPTSIPRMSREARGALHQQVRAQDPVSPAYWEGVVRWRSLPSNIRGDLLVPLVPRPSDRVTPSLTRGPANYRTATRPADGGEERDEIRQEFGPPSLLAAALVDDMPDLASPSATIDTTATVGRTGGLGEEVDGRQGGGVTSLPPGGTVSLALVRRHDQSSSGGRWQVLLTRRPSGEWHLHGGKVEPGETEAAAVRRETLEEVDVAVADADLFRLSRLWVDGRRILLYGALVWTGSPRAAEPLTEVQWVDVSQLARTRPALPSLLLSQRPLLAWCERLDGAGGSGSGTAAMDGPARAETYGAALALEEGLRNEVRREGAGAQDQTV